MVRFKLVICAATLLAATVVAEDDLTLSQKKMQQLEEFVGTWKYVETKRYDGRVKGHRKKQQLKFEWINNKSHIQLTTPDGYREIIGWNVKHQRFASWGFGSHGGQGTYGWGSKYFSRDKKIIFWDTETDWPDGWGFTGPSERYFQLKDDQLTVYVITVGIWQVEYDDIYKRKKDSVPRPTSNTPE